jgi:hypothetical protein
VREPGKIKNENVSYFPFPISITYHRLVRSFVRRGMMTMLGPTFTRPWASAFADAEVVSEYRTEQTAGDVGDEAAPMKLPAFPAEPTPLETTPAGFFSDGVRELAESTPLQETPAAFFSGEVGDLAAADESALLETILADLISDGVGDLAD